ncbi:MAG: hypothetical protein ACRCZR_01500 [Cetobacterium sp.]
MLKKIKDIFKDQELENEVFELREERSALKRFIENELLKYKDLAQKKNRELESSLIEERSRTEKLKEDFINKLVTEKDLLTEERELKEAIIEQVKFLNKKIVEQSGNLSRLDEELLIKEELRVKLSKELSLQVEKIKSETIHRKELEKELENLNKELVSKEEQKADLLKRLSNESEEKSNLEKELFIEKEKLEKLTKKSEELKSIVEDLRAQLALKGKDDSELEKQLILKEKSNFELKNELIDFQKKIDELENSYLEELELRENETTQKEKLKQELAEKALQEEEKEKTQKKLLLQKSEEILELNKKLETLKNNNLQEINLKAVEVIEKENLKRELLKLENSYLEELKLRESESTQKEKLKQELEEKALQEEEKEKAHKKLLLQKSEEILELNKKLEVLKNKDLEEKKLKELQITEKEEIEQNIFEEEKHWKDYDIKLLTKDEILKIVSKLTVETLEEIRSESEKRNLLTKSQMVQIKNISNWLEFGTNISTLNIQTLEKVYITLMNALDREKTVTEIEVNDVKKNWKDYDVNSLSKLELLKIASNFTVKEIEEIRVESKQRNLLTQLQRVQLSDIENWVGHGTILNSFNVEALKIIYVNLMNHLAKEKAEREKRAKEFKETENSETNFEFEGKWGNYTKYLQSKNNLIPLLNTFNFYDFQEIHKEGKRRGILKYKDEKDLTSILTRLKLNLPLTTFGIEKVVPFYKELMEDIYKRFIDNSDEQFNFKKYNSDDWFKLYENSKNYNYITEWFRKYILTLSEYRKRYSELNDSQTQVLLNNYTSLTKLVQDIEKSVEEKNVEIEKVVQEPEKVAQVPSFNGKWCNYEKFSQNKNYLIDLLRTFNANDFREMQLEGKKRGLLKFGQERDISNIITRLKLELLLTEFSLEKVEPFYESLMKDIYKESNLEKPTEKPVEKVTVETNLNPVDSNVEKDFDIESYTAKDWYKLYEFSKDEKDIKEWLRKYIFTIARYMEENLPITNNQYATIRNNYVELYVILGKLEKNRASISGPEITKLGEWSNFERYSTHKDNLVYLIAQFNLIDFKEILQISREKSILTEMELRQVLNVITWLKLNTPLTNLNLEKVEKIYIKIMKYIHPDKEILDYKEPKIKELEIIEEIKEVQEVQEPVVKTFNDFIVQGLKDGAVNMEELKLVDFENDNDAYDIYEAIEILEDRGIRINY